MGSNRKDPRAQRTSDDEELSNADSLEEGMKKLESEMIVANCSKVPDTVFENEVPNFPRVFTPYNDYDCLPGHKKSVNDFDEEKLNEDDAASLWTDSYPITDRFFFESRPMIMVRFPSDSFTIGFISRALMISSLQLGILPLLLTLMECVILGGVNLNSLKATSKIGIKINKSEKVSTIANLKKELIQLDAVFNKRYRILRLEAEQRMGGCWVAIVTLIHIHSMDLAKKGQEQMVIEGR
ncbi:hypothetical protein Tco_1142702 [Tanacetum coccineum]